MSLLDLNEFKEIAPPQTNETDMLFTVELMFPPAACPHCGCVANLYKHGKKEQLVMDMPIRMKRVGILIHRNRYKCRECEATFWERMNEVNDVRKMTKRLVEYIEKESMNRTFTDVAELTGVTEGTVRNIFKEYCRRREAKYKFVTPRILGIDEIYVGGKPRLILTNIKERTIFDMVDNRKQDNVIKRLESLSEPERVELVTMDMWYPYRRSVYQCLPNAKVVIDKFHVVRMGNNALETVRKKVRLNVSSAERKALMYDRKILLKREHDLDPRGALLIQIWLDKFPELKEAYILKEKFYLIWDSPGIDAAIENYRDWLELLKDASPLVQAAYSDIPKAFENWGTEIFNYFLYPYTNAYTESLNGLVRKLDQMGRGYSFEALRAKLLYNEDLHLKRRTRFDKGRFNNDDSMSYIPLVNANYGVSISTLLDTDGLED